MASSVAAFSAAELPNKVQVDVKGRKRKLPDGRARLDLRRDCELLKLLQYSCEVENPEQRDAPIKCWPVQRLFRKCQDKKGSFMVETTAWEGFKGCPADIPAEAPQDKPRPADEGKFWVTS